jgi:hypothetical protein
MAASNNFPEYIAKKLLNIYKKSDIIDKIFNQNIIT